MSKIELIIAPREKDLGGFHVRRILPYAKHRMVGPFVFFDHMGPATFAAGEGIDVRPHPHIGLSTVTYLFEGKIRHRDSLGSDQIIEPGAINWMTAGRGIVHSERSPEDFRRSGGRMNGIQVWVALPEEHEDTEPGFFHHPAMTLPEFEIEGVNLKLLLGSAFGYQSPVKTHSELFYLDVKLPQGSRLNFPAHGEAAVYLAEGNVNLEGQALSPFSMAVIRKCETLAIEASEPSRVMLLGGQPVGERFIYWNLVSSKKGKLEEAKKDWTGGPRPGARFGEIPGDNQEFIPLPQEPGNPRGTVM